MLRAQVEVAESVAEVGGKLIYGSTKNHRARTIELPRSLRDMPNTHLTEHVGTAGDALMFTASGRSYPTKTIRSGTPLRNSNFAKRIWRPAVAIAGLPTALRIHDLRHTTVALMIAAGAHPEHIKRHLGHSSITVTMDKYGHLFPSESTAVADRLDAALHLARTDRPRTRPLVNDPPSADAGQGSHSDQGLRLWAR